MSSNEGLSLEDESPGRGVREAYWFRNGSIFRRVSAGEFSGISSLRIPGIRKPAADKLRYWWDFYELRGIKSATRARSGQPLKIADLFCGCGGFALGISRAAKAVGLDPVFVLAADTDPRALAVFKQNLNPETCLNGNLWSMIDLQLTRDPAGLMKIIKSPTIIHPALRSLRDNVDILIGGPPCEGHSNYNNATRRNDPRNLLYLVPFAVGLATRARTIVVENVPEVTRDRFGQVVAQAKSLALASGYNCTDLIINVRHIGVPQTRRRHILVASQQGVPDLSAAVSALKTSDRDVAFAIRDLMRAEGSTHFDEPSAVSETNQERIDYLFRKRIYDLPNSVRPNCHRQGTSYTAVYGRLKWDLPSGTITTGFMTPGRGRYTHPQARRALTPHEGARLQGIPDDFTFDLGSEKQLKRIYSKLIGDAVPPRLGYAAGLAAIASLRSQKADHAQSRGLQTDGGSIGAYEASP